MLDAAHVRAKRGGELAGPSPVDRGKPGSKMHILSDAAGLPLRVGLSAANTHDSLALKPMLSHFHMGHESHAGDSLPQRLRRGSSAHGARLVSLCTGLKRHEALNNLQDTEPQTPSPSCSRAQIWLSAIRMRWAW
ncbi:transposase [Streptomyces griseocarneus]|uniref:Transposase n=1 Tax=Streptomyces griseocarneus TaxID=51201 RepID=A0ABX7RPY6_9ACTN|nr:transposase [Streptomyces griseocarneus]